MNEAQSRYIPWDIEVARLNFGANCGPSAFAAVTGREVCRIMRYFSHFERSPWTNLSQMKSAFREVGLAIEVHRRAFPRSGVALIQWLGPWTEPEFFSRWSLLHSHWIAVDEGWVFDHTIGYWQELAEWKVTAAAEFVTDTPRAHGWAVKYGIEVVKSSSSCRISTDKTEAGPSWQSELSLSG